MADPIKLDRSNRHPVDELGDLRDTIKRLERREAELREMIIDKKCGRQGEEFTAYVETRKNDRLDSALVVKEWGMERLRGFFRTTQTTYVTVKRHGKS